MDLHAFMVRRESRDNHWILSRWRFSIRNYTDPDASVPLGPLIRVCYIEGPLYPMALF